MMAPSLLSRLRTVSLSSQRHTDEFLTHLSRLLSTTSGVEATLCTLYYTLTLVHSQLTRILTQRYERFALAITAKASETMLPGETIIATIEPPHLALRDSCIAVKSAGRLVYDVRSFIRLWGLVNIYAWAKQTYLQPPRDVVIKILTWAQIGAKATFQALENGAFLAHKGVLLGGKWEQRLPRWWALSNRFYMAHVVLEMLRLLRVRQLRFNEEFGAQNEEDKEVKVRSKALEKKWRRDLYANAGWIIPTLHWSAYSNEEPTMNEALLGLSGMIPGVLALQDAWREKS